MDIEPKASGHWTDEQLIASLYGVGPEEDHLLTCAACRARASSMQATREHLDALASTSEVSFEFLAAQRRSVYEKLSKSTWGLSRLGAGRSITSAAAILVLSGGLLFYERHEQSKSANHQVIKVSDAQLAEDVGRLAQDPEPQPTGPLQALFQE